MMATERKAEVDWIGDLMSEDTAAPEFAKE